MSKEVTIKHTYKLKRGKEEALVALNPMILDGEPIVAFMEDGSVNMKVGDGVHTYNELDWIKGDDTPTVPFINLGHIELETFEQEIDNLPFDNCVGVVSVFGYNTMCYFEQWSTHANDKRQLRKYSNDKGFEERYMLQVGPSDYVWSSWSPITIDIIDTGNHFDSTKLDDVLNQLGSNQVIDLGEFTSTSALSSYDWKDGELYRFYLQAPLYNGDLSGLYVAYCTYVEEVNEGYTNSWFRLNMYNYTLGTSLMCDLRHGNSIYLISPLVAYGERGIYVDTSTYVSQQLNSLYSTINYDIHNITPIHNLSELSQFIHEELLPERSWHIVDFQGDLSQTCGGGYCVCTYTDGQDIINYFNLSSGKISEINLGTTKEKVLFDPNTLQRDITLRICDGLKPYDIQPTFPGYGLYEYLYARFVDASYITDYQNIPISSYVNISNGIFTYEGNYIPAGIYRVEGEFEYSYSAHYGYYISLTNIKSNISYQGYINLYNKPTSFVDDNFKLDFTNLTVTSVPDYKITDENNPFYNKSISEALSELDETDIIDLGTISSPSAFAGATDYTQHKWYRFNWSYNGTPVPHLCYCMSSASGYVLHGINLVNSSNVIVYTATGQMDTNTTTYIKLNGAAYKTSRDNAIKLTSEQTYTNKQSIDALSSTVDEVSSKVDELNVFKPVNSKDELATYLSEEYNKHSGTKPVYIEFTDKFFSSFGSNKKYGKCIGIIFPEVNGTSYKFHDVETAAQGYYITYQGNFESVSRPLAIYVCIRGADVRTALRATPIAILDIHTPNTEGTYLVKFNEDTNETKGISLSGDTRIELSNISSGDISRCIYNLDGSTFGSGWGAI